MEFEGDMTCTRTYIANYLVWSGEEDKDPNEHGLGSFPVLFTAQLP